ncbi:MAG: hypothetical protein JWN71_3186 [Xanthobacteraceae bacterium]|jgi:hypothetical protein|nr:hypothetical protein [Xanthobacteraceae bacterium]
MQMFEQSEVSAELEKRLRAAGLDPADPTVQAVNTIVSGYFAERTAEVLTKVREVLDKVGKDGLH